MYYPNEKASLSFLSDFNDLFITNTFKVCHTWGHTNCQSDLWYSKYLISKLNAFQCCFIDVYQVEVPHTIYKLLTMDFSILNTELCQISAYFKHKVDVKTKELIDWNLSNFVLVTRLMNVDSEYGKLSFCRAELSMQ